MTSVAHRRLAGGELDELHPLLDVVVGDDVAIDDQHDLLGARPGGRCDAAMSRPPQDDAASPLSAPVVVKLFPPLMVVPEPGFHNVIVQLRHAAQRGVLEFVRSQNVRLNTCAPKPCAPFRSCGIGRPEPQAAHLGDRYGIAVPPIVRRLTCIITVWLESHCRCRCNR